MPIIDLWLSVAGKPWAHIRMVEILLDKGPLAAVSGPKRRAFVGERRAVPGVSLSDRVGHGVVTLDSARAATQEWFKGTLKAVYDTESQRDALISDIAIKEAVADAAHSAIHPSQVHIVDGQVSCPALPLDRISVELEQTALHACRASASLQTDWQPLRTWYNDKLGMQQGGFGDLLHWALLSRYVRHIIVADPAAMTAIRGRPVLLLANHQVQIESILGTTVASWLTGTQVVTIAHAKHETRWFGGLLRLVETVTGRELGHIRYFDQQNPRQFIRLVKAMKSDVTDHGVSTMVHADGTRYVRSGQRVERLTSTLLDMATICQCQWCRCTSPEACPRNRWTGKLEVPYRQAAQDYIFGRPIMPEELTRGPTPNVDAASSTPSTRWPHTVMRRTNRTTWWRTGLLSPPGASPWSRYGLA